MGINVGKFSVKNAVLVNILLITILVLGVSSVVRIPQEQFSEVPFYWVNILVPYPGTAAEDIEKTVTIKIENELEGIKRVKKIQSVTQEGLALVRVEFDDGISNEEFARLYQEVQTRFNNVNLPDGTLDPIIDDFSSSDFFPVIEVVFNGSTDFKTMSQYSKLLYDRLISIKDVSKIDRIGARDKEIIIKASRTKLESLGISLGEIVAAIAKRNTTIPGGTLNSASEEFIIRTVSELEGTKDFGELIIRENSGKAVHIKDVADEISEEYESNETVSRFNGKESISLKIAKTPQTSSTSVVDQVKREVEEFRKTLPEGLSLTYLNDSSVQIRSSSNVILTNAFFGFVLLIIILLLFLGFRNAFITALGIPVAFAITFAVMDLLGETLNTNSLFGLVLVLGLIVDHSIVMIENCYRLEELGFSKMEAAVNGTNQVVLPVLAATLTTVAAFLPLMILPGIFGKFLRIIPLVVTIALLASTAEAIFFLPAHFLEWSGKPKKSTKALFIRIKGLFEKIFDKVYRRRYLTAGITMTVTVLVIVLSSFIPQDLFSGEDFTLFYIDIEMAPGANLKKTSQVVGEFEQRLAPLVGNGEIAAIRSSIGFASGGDENTNKSNIAQITVDVTEQSEGRKRPINSIIEDVKKLCFSIAGPENVSYRKIRGGPPVEPPISFQLFGDNYEDLEIITKEIKAKLSTYPQLYNIQDSLDLGTPEYRITVNEEQAVKYGLSVQSIGAFLRGTLEGVEATTIFKANEETKVIVKYSHTESMQPENLLLLKIPTSDGRLISFSTVCSLQPGESIASIKRVDGKRQVSISAEATDKRDIRNINSYFEKWFKETYGTAYPGISFKASGEFAEFADLLSNILRIFLLGLFFIYLILGTQFKSYSQPVLILFSVPFAFVGVIAYLIISQTPFSTTVLYASVALAGIAVNDSIVLISYANELKLQGKQTAQAIKEATLTRVRPILLTSITTMAGLIPTAIGLGGYSVVWGPMARTIIFGLLFSTLTALLLIPSLYGILSDWQKPKHVVPAD